MNQGLRRATPLAIAGRGRLQDRSVSAGQAALRKWAPERWRDAGRCRDSDPNLFYPVGRGQAALEQTEAAKSVCQGCPSREPCLAFALASRQELGVWGGTSPEDRRQLVRRQRSPVAS